MLRVRLVDSLYLLSAFALYLYWFYSHTITFTISLFKKLSILFLQHINHPFDVPPLLVREGLPDLARISSFTVFNTISSPWAVDVAVFLIAKYHISTHSAKIYI